MIVLHETAQIDDVERVRTVVTATTPPNADLLPDNPLCQIPTLLLDDGTTVFDSGVICDYLDERAGRTGLFPQSGPGRYRQLRWNRIGDGLTKLLQTYRNESIRTEGGNTVWLSAYRTKIRACLSAVNAETADLDASTFGIGQISLICALGQMNFRYAHTTWRMAYPLAAAWYEAQRERPSVAATEIVDDSLATLGSSPFAEAKVPMEL